MKPVSYMAIVLCVMLFLTGCSSGAVDEEVNESVQNKTAVQNKTEPFTRNTKIEDVINAPSFDGFGRLLFPTDEYYYSGDTLEELQLTYYSHIDPDETVEIVNTLRERAADGQTIFYDIYTEEEKAARSAAIQEGLKGCTKTPMEMMELIDETLTLAQSLLGRFNDTSASDLGVAFLSLKAGIQGAWLNVLINVGSLKDQEFAAEYRAKGEALLAHALPLADECYAEIVKLIEG